MVHWKPRLGQGVYHQIVIVIHASTGGSAVSASWGVLIVEAFMLRRLQPTDY